MIRRYTFIIYKNDACSFNYRPKLESLFKLYAKYKDNWLQNYNINLN